VDIPLYELTTDSTNGSIENIGEYYPGKEVTLKAVPNPGYKFKQWADGDTNPTKVVTVRADATYTAIFEPSILVGDKAVKEIYVGNKKVKEVYIGDKKVWE
jgi:hypothetical protein